MLLSEFVSRALAEAGGEMGGGGGEALEAEEEAKIAPRAQLSSPLSLSLSLAPFL